MSIFRGVKVTIPHPLPCRPIDSSQVMLVEPPRESNPRLDAHHSRHTPGRIHLSRGAKNTTHLKPCGRNQKDDVESMTQPCTYFGRHPCHFAPTRRARARSNLLFMLSRPSRMPHTPKAPPNPWRMILGPGHVRRRDCGADDQVSSDAHKGRCRLRGILDGAPCSPPFPSLNPLHDKAHEDSQPQPHPQPCTDYSSRTPSL